MKSFAVLWGFTSFWNVVNQFDACFTGHRLMRLPIFFFWRKLCGTSDITIRKNIYIWCVCELSKTLLYEQPGQCFLSCSLQYASNQLYTIQTITLVALPSFFYDSNSAEIICKATLLKWFIWSLPELNYIWHRLCYISQQTLNFNARNLLISYRWYHDNI